MQQEAIQLLQKTDADKLPTLPHVLLRLLDPAEQSLAIERPAMFHDLETGRDVYVDPAAAREEYLRRFAEHRDGVGRACNALGIDLFQMTIDRPLELVLFDFLNARLRRGRQIARRGPSLKGGRR